MLSNRELYVANLIGCLTKTDIEDIALEIKDCRDNKSFNTNRHKTLNLFIDAIRRLSFEDEVYLRPFEDRALSRREREILCVLSLNKNLNCLSVTQKIYDREEFNDLYIRKRIYGNCYISLSRLKSFGYVRGTRSSATARKNTMVWNITEHGKHKLTLPRETGRRYNTTQVKFI